MDKPVVRLGPVSHIGIAVEDVDKAAAFYERVFGMGPFHIQDYEMGEEAEYYLVDGKPAKPSFRAALAFYENFFIEIVQVTKGETTHTRFLKRHGEGLQHLCFLVEDTQSILEKLKGEGIEPVIDYQFIGTHDGKKTKIHEVYLNTDVMPGGTMIQLLEYIPVE